MASGLVENTLLQGFTMRSPLELFRSMHEKSIFLLECSTHGSIFLFFFAPVADCSSTQAEVMTHFALSHESLLE